jgi:hypothetical protein
MTERAEPVGSDEMESYDREDHNGQFIWKWKAGKPVHATIDRQSMAHGLLSSQSHLDTCIHEQHPNVSVWIGWDYVPSPLQVA